jgi:hypothetical protein
MTIYRNSLQILFFIAIFNPFLPICIASISELALTDGFAPPFLTTGSDEFSAGPAPHKSTDVALKTLNETVPGKLSQTKLSADARNSTSSSIPTVENPSNVVVALRNGTNEVISNLISIAFCSTFLNIWNPELDRNSHQFPI